MISFQIFVKRVKRIPYTKRRKIKNTSLHHRTSILCTYMLCTVRISNAISQLSLEAATVLDVEGKSCCARCVHRRADEGGEEWPPGLHCSFKTTRGNCFYEFRTLFSGTSVPLPRIKLNCSTSRRFRILYSSLHVRNE